MDEVSGMSDSMMSGCDGCDMGCLCYTPCRPKWGVRAGAAILHRDRPDAITLARPLGGLFDISTGSDFDFGWTGGLDLAIERRLGNSCNSVEVRYLGALDWDSQVSYDLFGSTEIGDSTVIGGDFLDSSYESSLDSIEFNFRHQSSDRFTWLVGFRIVDVDETLNKRVNFIIPSLVDMNWHTENTLYGAQIGGDFQLWRLSGPLRVNSVMKAGIYGNDASNDFTFSLLNIPLVNGGASGSQTAFVGEINVNASYQVTQNLAIRGGYQLLWIDGLALASHQAGQTLLEGDINILDSSSGMFYHGALVGADLVW